MKSYPSISTKPVFDVRVHCFEKIDGSQIRVEWSRKQSFYKFGSRKRLVDENNLLGASKNILEASFAEPLERILVDNKWERAICFFEFAGPQSFAGSHVVGDDLQLTLFDVAPYKRGIMFPDEFVKVFGGLNIPDILHVGKIDEEFVEEIRANTELAEGIVCKGKGKHKGEPLMFKIKTRAWIDKVKAKCGGDENKLRELL